MKISVYAICHNEAKFVDRWMKSMSEADEICVLDTGSTDGTMILLKEAGAKVERKVYTKWNTIEEYKAILERGETPWRFDWARNDSMKLVSPDTDIMVCTDLDEVLLPGWRAKLENAWKEAVERGEKPTTATYDYIWNFNPDGTDGSKFTYEKVHKPGVCKWAHPVHEVLDYEGEKVCVPVEGMRLEHHADPMKSRGQYLKLLELSVWECPDDDRNAHYLGREYMFNGMYSKAIEQLKRHLEMPTARWYAERSASMRYIAKCYTELGETEKAVEWFRFAIAEAPDHREAAVEMAQMAYEQTLKADDKDIGYWWKCVVEGGEAAIKVQIRQTNYLTKSENWGEKPYDLLSLGYWYTGDKDNARRAVWNALELSGFRNKRIRDNAKFMLFN